METNVIAKRKIPEGSMRRRREAMEAMVSFGKDMIKAHGNSGVLPLPEKYNSIAILIQEFIEWRKKQVFITKTYTREELF